MVHCTAWSESPISLFVALPVWAGHSFGGKVVLGMIQQFAGTRLPRPVQVGGREGATRSRAEAPLARKLHQSLSRAYGLSCSVSCRCGCWMPCQASRSALVMARATTTQVA